ncbi:unnamed protein product [Angiostrongylus costaricensis]|uniref:BTB domain-containing protein n=1 Tax=Angiostrongylus costaricensis TaxID=334426 RepID=A0A0R3PL52_ANGCS|nr:unnamed protein product [Angiostrongylus costaricensis]
MITVKERSFLKLDPRSNLFAGIRLYEPMSSTMFRRKLYDRGSSPMAVNRAMVIAKHSDNESKQNTSIQYSLLSLGNNCPPNQYPPEVKDIYLTLIGKSEVQIPLTRSDECFVAESLLPLSKLNIIMDQLPTLTMRVLLTIPSSYFLLDELIDLNLKQPPTTPAAEKVLATILAGGKPPGYDWVITVADGSPREYFVHRKILTYFYLRQFHFPNYDSIARVGRTLCSLLPQEKISTFFEYWQAEIVRDLLKLNKKEYKSTLLVCTRHLISIFSAPYGAMPVAKRVAVATMADTWQMAEAAGLDVQEEFKNAKDLPMGMMEKIFYSAGKFRTVVSGVRKTAV